MNNLFNDDFIIDLKNSLDNGVYQHITDMLDIAIKSNERTHHLEALNLFENILEIYEIHEIPKYNFRDLEMGNLKDNLSNVRTQIEKILIRKSNFKRFNQLFSGGFSYKFSEKDISRIQTLINELREHIQSSDLFENEHKQRLLKRLETLQAEMHKKMSDIDRFWGLVGDAGVAIGKFGKNAKPFVDRIKEISEIVWKTQSKAEKLPEDGKHPLLKNVE